MLVSGGLGLVYLPLSTERLTLEQIDEAHPRLLDTLTAHPGIGFVMVRSQAHGALVIGGAGRRRLSDDAVEGEDPLAHFDATAADHLRRHDSLPPLPGHSRQLHVRPERRRGRPVRGVHGLTRRSRRAADAGRSPSCRPSGASRPAPIVGVEAMHEALRNWLAQTHGGVRP